MKKLFTIFILFFAICVALSNTYAQNNHNTFQNYKNTEVLLGTDNQEDYLSHFNKQKPFISAPEKTTVDLKTKSLIQLNDSIYKWDWDTITNGWDINPNNKAINFVYDANNNMTSSLWQSWYGSTWDNEIINTYTYDANNNMTSFSYQNWNGSSWDNNTLITCTYDANNNMTSSLWQSWNGTIWVNSLNSLLFTYTCDANNKITSRLTQNWNGTAWVNHVKENFTYDVNNKITSLLTQLWNGTSWDNSQLATWTYDANNKVTFLIQNWNGSSWDNNNLYNYTYDANNKITSYLIQRWDGTAWGNSSQYIYTYDVNNNITSGLDQTWNGTAWVNHVKENFTYDVNNFTKSDARITWNSTGNKIKWGDSAYYYFHTVVGINDLMAQSESINIYPNPATYNVTLNISNRNNEALTLNIYNVIGTLVKSEMLRQNNQQINIGDLSNGVYMVTIKSKDFAENQRLIIQR